MASSSPAAETWLLENGNIKPLSKEMRHGHGRSHGRTAHNVSSSSLRKKSDLTLVRKVPCAIIRDVLANVQEVILGTKLFVLFIAIPIAILAHYKNFGRSWVFGLSLLGLTPLAERVSFLTEQIAFFTGPTVGGLLNATCGNATELIIAIFALIQHKVDVVKYSLLGSILSNLLLVLGTSLFCGGIANLSKEQKYDRKQADVNSLLLLLGLLCHVLPLMFRYAGVGESAALTQQATLQLSRVSCIIMLIAYIGYLVFQLWTHRQLFDAQAEENEDDDAEDEEAVLGFWSAFAWLVGMTILIALLSEYVVGTAGVAYSVITTENDRETLIVDMPRFERHRANPKDVAAVILGGGEGAKLFPLTSRTATPAVPIGGCYKLIDIPMSNCINSAINKIFVLTQYNSAPLNRHIARTYFGNGVSFGDGFVEILAATQTPGETGKRWFQGTADAVRQFIWVFEDAKNKNVENILILSGDHLYRMDYMELVQNHIDRNADITLSCAPAEDSRASDFGLVKIDSRGRVVQFSEKPKGFDLKAMQVDTTLIGLSPKDAKKSPYIASMGVYVFKTDVLLKLLKWRYPTANDFGSEIIPAAIDEYNVQAYIFRDYWEDIGTLKTFYDASLALTAETAKFQFYDPKTPFYTSPSFLPPTKIDNCKIKDAIISHGCFLRDCSVEHSIVGERSRLDCGVELKDTYMMGADYYQTESEIASLLAEGKVPIGIGENTKIRKCIIDKNAKIGKNVVIMNKDDVQEAARPEEGFYIRSGITIILEKATIRDGTVI